MKYNILTTFGFSFLELNNIFVKSFFGNDERQRNKYQIIQLNGTKGYLQKMFYYQITIRKNFSPHVGYHKRDIW